MAVRDQSEVTDPQEAVRQEVKEEATNELLRRERHYLGTVVIGPGA